MKLNSRRQEKFIFNFELDDAKSSCYLIVNVPFKIYYFL